MALRGLPPSQGTHTGFPAARLEVKQIMEEAVTRKFVHEDSSHILALCGSAAGSLCGPGAVEACLLHQLRRRAAGFLRSDKVAALFTKLGKTCPVAGEICHKVQELQQQVEGRKPLVGNQETLRRQASASGKAPALSLQALKHIWVRTALMEKVLDRVVQYLVENCSKYYEKEALLADPVFGPILASLLVGPCALEYTKLKTADHYWTDPSADELVQRHRIRGPPNRQDSPAKRPALGIRKRHSSGSASEDRLAACAREYVESLHQNSRTRLLYGKNNVLVQPKEDMEAVPGYLSLHQSAESLTLKWTPNQLMNGTLGDSELEKSVYWDYALVVPFSQIVCIHCHQQTSPGHAHPAESGGTLVLVSQDGVQRPPLHFPQGGHLLSFLSCLESGLLPRGQLEPPLWTQQGKGKVFPRLRKRSSMRSADVEDVGAGRTTDYVFRIIYPGHRHEHITINYHHLAASRAASVDDDEEEEDKLHAMLSMICSRNLTAPNPMKDAGDMIEMQGFGPSLPAWHLEPLCSQGSSCLSCSTSSSPYAPPSHCSCVPNRLPLRLLCESMKRQIVSRAFYGWLAYCRHLSTVRTHLSALVHHHIIPPARPPGASAGLTKDVWSKYQKDEKNYKALELLRQVYCGGVEHEIRRDVWPFLLGHYKFGMSKKEMEQVDTAVAARYQRVLAEWKACEVVVRQREREAHPTTLTKFSSGSSIDSHVQHLVHRDSTISNDVFVSVDDLEPPKPPGPEDPSAEPAQGVGTGPTGTAAVEQQSVEFDSPDSGLPSSRNYSVASGIQSSTDEGQSMGFEEEDGGGEEGSDGPGPAAQVSGPQDPSREEASQVGELEAGEELAAACAATYTIELLDTVALNLHRIDKDVQRCDRNYWYFTAPNLERLRDIMCSYVWQHLDVGYVQGMCDLLAPLLVVLDNDQLAYSCFSHLMKRMSQNFPNGGAMDAHFANMRSLIQILDSELFELMHQNGDYTHFYFCYRWFLLDFKRELPYEDVFAVWEVIWAARHISSEHFVLFLALALLEAYREIIRDNNMDFTDIIKFFNERAEHHDAQEILRIARDLVHKVQMLIENK
ncbi:small G protein signaling modulator 2 isoform X1 [Hippopotamus amphibius kiboko]|uniref:small G protein signaling modulator 2 isoform X1 n=1 Tax=Hippopotamus amphibius kiboko TaxID=575201 RepID=UPI0025945E7F|nr:small G protein signaling modulator 2 isoform X1 [Hippopotamus amphibius kiboko]XP_057570294.1 small G protein signaling modulator 2 isoform X1 [Hippopotamus amphibius kiboko]